jgi:hypothetical protein
VRREERRGEEKTRRKGREEKTKRREREERSEW